ncbi:MAG TPA: hypothetical protein VL993_12985 [Stellaceae bacterium]|nr:hypothetical protein [Stellaceae bacterium]
MSIVRMILGAAGILLIAGALYLVARGAPAAVLIGPGVVGILFIIGALFERAFYKNPVARAPGGGFVATPERFVDPSSGRMVEVHVKPATGERVYVDVGPAPPHEGQ